jgi:RecA-family ATPase
MSTRPIEDNSPAWNKYRVPVFRGLYDSKIDTGEDYETKPLATFFSMPPWNKAKASGPAFVPSLHHDYDAREHASQREKGRFVALTGDIDSGDHTLAAVKEAVEAFAGNAARLIYSSPHARPGDMRWRVILPLDEPQPFDTWYDAQSAFFAFMEARGFAMDHALARAAQPVFLPNVPLEHAKSGAPLRGEGAAPLYYVTETNGTDAPGLPLDVGPVSEGIAAIRLRRVEDERAREQVRREAEARRAAKPRGESASLIDDFNSANSVAAMLELCGYEQSPRSAEDWRSPHQTGDTYATRIIGSKWVSLSASDAAAGVGEKCKSGCFGDAYDLFVHYKHGGDHKAAYRALGQERRDANIYYLPQAEPPEWMNQAPPYEDMPEWAEIEPVLDEPEVLEPQQPTQLPVFSPADWQGVQAPERVWRWENFIPDLQATLLTGAGAAGKSLATQQQSTCIAMGIPFLGVPVRQAPALYITCEDDMEELHRRQEAICASLGITMEETRGKLFLLSLQGAIGNELATFAPDGKMSVAPRYFEIESLCLELGIKHVTIDNTAHTFAGNENDRHQVAAYVGLNNKLALTIGGSVVMVGHPNKAGDSYSGSTAWENQVRSRLYLEVPKSGEEGAPIDPDMRVLRNEKANYSQRGAEVRFFWAKGAFVLEEALSQEDRDTSASTQAFHENKLFLSLLDMLTEQRRNVSHKPRAGNYAPKIMAGMPAAKGYSKANFERAMERLFMLEEIVADAQLWLGKDRHPVIGLGRK